MARITVEMDKCIGAGMCVLAAPGSFDQRDEDGKVVLLQDGSDPDELPDVERAIELCPAAAIGLSRD